jgi:Ca2+-transporting ATPase
MNDPRRGLDDAEALARLQTEGRNELPHAAKRSPLRIVGEVLREPMLALLVAGGAIYFILGDVRDAAILLVFALLSVVITVVQEARTERVLEALRDLSSPRAMVVRGGVLKRIAGSEVVRGDIIKIAEGDRVAADTVVLNCRDLAVDESILTGEAVAVRKDSTDDPVAAQGARPGGDGSPLVYSGTLVVRGEGHGVVTATGPRTEIGRIGISLRGMDEETPVLRRQAMSLVRMMAIAGIGVSVTAGLLYGVMRQSWLDGLLGGIALGMSMLPEELPVILTVFTAMGAWRISRANVLTRRAAAIEALGSATVLCTDKTGTLTQNRMTIVELQTPDGASVRIADAPDAMPPDFEELVRVGRLASSVQPFDPMEKAFHALADAALPDGEVSGDDLLRHYPLRPELLAVTQVWRMREEVGARRVAAKGAPEAIADLCRLDQAARGRMLVRVDVMAAAGMRVLGIARARDAMSSPPDSVHAFEFEFLGLVGLADPLRSGAREAIAECRSAGIRVVMITGDYPVTARAIARDAGLAADRVVTGEDVAAMPADDLAQAARTVNVFARIMPEQKLRIIEAIKASGDIVAMTGDGVNDAPSLKAAHIGIAMGKRGTDVAREASSIVLLDDDFASIVSAVRLGRRIHDNIRKAIGFVFAVHVPIAGIALLPLLLGLPVVLAPVHIAFLEMFIDPVCSLAFEAEPEEADIMRRPPRPPEQPLFSAALVVWSLLQGAVALLFTGGVFLWAHAQALPEDEVRALTFFSVVVAIAALILANRSYRATLLGVLGGRNGVLAAVLAIVAAVSVVTLTVPWARELFRFGPLHQHDAAVIALTGAAVLLALELLKPLFRRKLAE